MTPSSPQGHRGLAQRIRSLFDDPPPPRALDSADPADVAWVSETARPVAAGVPEPDAPGPLAEAVEVYVLAGPAARDAAATALDRAIDGVRQGPASPEMADAVESLLQYAARQTGALERARALTSPGVAALLVRRLSDLPEGERRSRLLQRLPELGEEILQATLDTFRMPPPEGLKGGGRTGPLALLGTVARSRPGMLEELVQDPDWRVVGAAVSITSDRGGDDALQILTLALEHSHPRVRRQALAAVRKLGGQEAGGLALSKLDDPDRGVRIEATRTLGDLNVARAVAPLLGRLQVEEHPEALTATLRALGDLRDPSVVPELATWAMRREADFEVRSTALRALHDHGGPHATGVLEQAAGDEDPAIRHVVADLLAREGSESGSESPEAPEA